MLEKMIFNYRNKMPCKSFWAFVSSDCILLFFDVFCASFWNGQNREKKNHHFEDANCAKSSGRKNERETTIESNYKGMWTLLQTSNARDFFFLLHFSFFFSISAGRPKSKWTNLLPLCDNVFMRLSSNMVIHSTLEIKFPKPNHLMVIMILRQNWRTKTMATTSNEENYWNRKHITSNRKSQTKKYRKMFKIKLCGKGENPFHTLLMCSLKSNQRWCQREVCIKNNNEIKLKNKNKRASTKNTRISFTFWHLFDSKLEKILNERCYNYALLVFPQKKSLSHEKRWPQYNRKKNANSLHKVTIQSFVTFPNTQIHV